MKSPLKRVWTDKSGNNPDEGGSIMTAWGAVPFAKHGATGNSSSSVGTFCAVTSDFFQFLLRTISASDKSGAFATAVQGAVPPPTG